MSTPERVQRRRHLRDAATICPAIRKLSNGLVIDRCELNAGHEGRHKDGCSHWPAAGSDVEARTCGDAQ